MRIRSIKPEFFTSETVARCPRPARLTFIGVWCYVDDNGVGVDNERLIVASLYPLDDDPSEALAETRDALRKLAEEGLIVRYVSEGKRLLFVVGWDEHQRIAHPKKARYERPSALTCADAELPQIAEVSGNPGATFSPEQGSGNRDQGSGITASAVPAPRAEEAQLFDVSTLPAPAASKPPASVVQALVGAYVDAVEAGGGIATKSMCGAIGGNLRRLIAQDKIEPALLLAAVQRAGAKRERNIDRHLGDVQQTWKSRPDARQALYDLWEQRARNFEAAS
jgi:hypothetical protein